MENLRLASSSARRSTLQHTSSDEPISQRLQSQPKSFPAETMIVGRRDAGLTAAATGDIAIVAAFLFFCLSLLSSSVTGLAVPKSEWINRRKSPALWRDDLLAENNNDDDHVQRRGASTTPSAEGYNNNKGSTSRHHRRLLSAPPEVMAPVGGWSQLHAAIGNGADAVYLGLSAFSARARATNFDAFDEGPEGLLAAILTAHDAGVKVYVALNTLVFDHELDEVEGLIRQCATVGVDALIVQDVGVARLAQRILDGSTSALQVHASTQQTVTSSDGAAFCEEVLGSTRVVLGRELSVDEIQTVADEAPHVELEAFVHGALCVSYSGQCFSSEFSGGRSANRGQCAQACRLPYGLIRDGELIDLADFSYLLSPQDLCGLEQVPQLLEANVHCLKIEGRLKDADYVAATTRAYRTAVDQAWQEYCQKYNIETTNTRRRMLANPHEIVTRSDLAQVFSRGQDENHDGLTSGFFEGSKHQELVRGRSPRHRGVHVGRLAVDCTSKSGLIVHMDDGCELKLGDGLVVDRGLAQEEELGGAIFEVSSNDGNDQATIHLSRDVVRNWKKYDDNARKGLGGHGAILAPKGAHVWKTSDAAVEKKMKRLSQSEAPRPTASVMVQGSVGRPLEIRIDDGRGHIGAGKTQGDLTFAESSGLTETSIKKAIGSLGNTKWALVECSIGGALLDEGIWCPLSWIKEARRHAIEDLEAQTLSSQTPTSIDFKEYNVVNRLLKDISSDSPITPNMPSIAKLSVLARNEEQVEVLCQMAEAGELQVDEIIVDFLEVDGMKDAVALVRQAGVFTVVASPRIIKPNESGIWRTLLRLQPDALLVRSTGLLRRMMALGGPGAEFELEGSTVRVPQLIGDFSLNVVNALAAWEILQYGCARVTASYDLGAHAITELLKTLGPEQAKAVEIVAHAHLPIFHTEHCVFARFLSNGDSYVDCGHPCTRHNVHLRDQTGADNLVLADMGCRNTVFAAQAQSGAHSVKEWMEVGANHFRIELVDESKEDVIRLVEGYRNVLDGKSKPRQLWETLEDIQDGNGRKAGVSHGSFRNGVERRAGEITI